MVVVDNYIHILVIVTVIAIINFFFVLQCTIDVIAIHSIVPIMFEDKCVLSSTISRSTLLRDVPVSLHRQVALHS